jgi:hypothetical protein
VLRLVTSVAAAALGLSLAAPVHAKTTPLFAGATYENDVQFTPHGPVAIRVVRAPRPVGLYRLRTVLSNESVLGRETVSSMQRRLAAQATMVGVNGDLSRIADGKPSGVFLRDGVLVSPPNRARSSAGFTPDGTLDVRRVAFFGTWRGAGGRRAINELNDSPGENGVALFTSDWGLATPRIPGSHAVVLSPFPAAVPNSELKAPVSSSAGEGPVSIPPGSAVLLARGSAIETLLAEAALGTLVTVQLTLAPKWPVADAIGGGPVLVRDGKPVYQALEAFTTSHLMRRHPRTAIGQRADGTILLVEVDGRSPRYSVGMTTFEMALTMLRLGAVRAMQLDGGGSSTLAFDGVVLNRPSDGRERPISTALMLQYYGVYLRPPPMPVVSPNGDDVAEHQAFTFKVVRPSTVSVQLTAPDGTITAEEPRRREPGMYKVPFPPEPAAMTERVTAEGRWTVTVTAVDDQQLASTASRRFSVNSTLGFLRVEPGALFLPRRRPNAVIRWALTRPASIRVTVETAGGIVVRTVADSRRGPGEQHTAWNGRTARNKLVASGRYVVRVKATNELGTVSLVERLTVRRAGDNRS